MTRLLTTVNPSGITTELLLALFIAKEVYRKFSATMWITSLTDGVHTADVHAKGKAADLRIKHLPPGIWNALATEIQAACGLRYDVLLETTPPADPVVAAKWAPHIHIQIARTLHDA
jgi:hypothetical protein